MAYVQSKVMKKRLQEKRRVSGAALLREELNATTAAGDSSSLLDSIQPVEKDKGVMMANFEEWIKMATDNKINTTNSWNFALIDYFHDMDVLRGKDNNINFQKASATLDGCVKIYSSRVDSVATETGRLLSGLATRKQTGGGEKKEREGDEDDKDEEGDSSDEDAGEGDIQGSAKAKARSSKISAKRVGDTLTSFESLRIKKLSEELNIDPLFKKTLAEFDEGGAKSLLLNALHIDDHGRVVFDANTSSRDGVKAKDDEEESTVDVEMSGMDEPEVDISPLKDILYKNGDDFDETTLCPSIEHLNSVLKDITQAKSILNGFNVQQESNDGESVQDIAEDGPDFEYGDNDNSYGELDNEAAAVIFQDEIQTDQEEVGNETGVVASVVDQDLMAYFDNTMKRSWAGPDHWKVRQFKKGKAHALSQSSDTVADPATAMTKQKKTKNDFQIDFMTPVDEDEENTMFAKGKTSTQLSAADREAKDSHLLPDDMYYTSDQLTRLFLKPAQKLNIFRRKLNIRTIEPSEDPDITRPVDATFWADNYKECELEKNKTNTDGGSDQGGYDDDDINIGGDYDFDMDYDAGTESNEAKLNTNTQLIAGGGKARLGALNYSKKAKNVNVKQLKDNLWKSIEHKMEEPELQLSDLVTDIGRLYPTEQRKDLSTSFCFICLLHLANEHGLTIENTETLTDLRVTGYDTESSSNTN